MRARTRAAATAIPAVVAAAAPSRPRRDVPRRAPPASPRWADWRCSCCGSASAASGDLARGGRHEADPLRGVAEGVVAGSRCGRNDPASVGELEVVTCSSARGTPTMPEEGRRAPVDERGRDRTWPVDEPQPSAPAHAPRSARCRSGSARAIRRAPSIQKRVAGAGTQRPYGHA